MWWESNDVRLTAFCALSSLLGALSTADGLCRCDCPNHKTVNAPWPGMPQLPAGVFANDFGVRMKGQFLVARPADGVVGETPAIFPNASDYHLLCLQVTADITKYMAVRCWSTHEADR